MSTDNKNMEKSTDDIMNPWLAEISKEYMETHSREELEREFSELCERRGNPSWKDFVARKALEEETRVHPFLMTPRQEMDLPMGILQLFKENYIDRILDLLQLTVEDLNELTEEHKIDFSPISSYLQAHGLHLYSYPQKTYKLSLEDPFGEDSSADLTVVEARQMALDCIKDSSIPVRDRMEQAIAIYEEADKLALATCCDPREHVHLLSDYLSILGLYMHYYKVPMKQAPVIVYRTVKMSEELYDAGHSSLAFVYQRAGKVYQELFNWEAAIKYLTLAADIMDNSHFEDERKDRAEVHESLGTCFFEMTQYESALGEFEKAYDIGMRMTPPDKELLGRVNAEMAETYKAMGDMTSFSVLKWTGPKED